MATLIAGYDSSDDEAAPVASTSTRALPRLDNGFAPDTADDDDDELDLRARKDAFGLSTKGGPAVERRAEAASTVMAAPDVLKEVRVLTWVY